MSDRSLEEKDLNVLVDKLHLEACGKEKDSYNDPKTGYLVMTAHFLKKRGYCCESGCRHCPYGFVTVRKT